MSDRDRVKIPADVEREDRVLAGLTARQLAILTVAALFGYIIFTLLARLLPAVVAAACVLPLLGLAAALALVRRDGVSLDRLLLAAFDQTAAPRWQVSAPTGARPPEGVGVLELPVRTVRPDGVLDLGSYGVAVLVDCDTVSFALRTAEEQRALVAAFGRWLNSLSHPIQLVAIAEPLDLAPAITRLRADAPALPHPALERAALDHAEFLTRLTTSRDLLRRRVLLVLREPYADGDLDGAARRVLRRAEDSVRALAGSAVSARLLDAEGASAVLAACADPGVPPGLARLAPPDLPITGDQSAEEERK
ncbi:PrgI family protein [Bailinhaonella thermotolerans]|uniref:PrgI family protein n=1 Tax=Bailinhaonella thermotolerans TaxID=1070861 RepID=UPI0011C3495F|nr:PrgI family protein [Bailinhaonella thermotolerans]